MGFNQAWTVELPGHVQVSSSDPTRESLLNNKGIQVRNTSLRRTSQLVFTGAVEVEATVWCEAGTTIGNRVEVRIYGEMLH